MADEYQDDSLEQPFSFLESEYAQSFFADLNIKLLQSRHIQHEDGDIFRLLVDYEPEFYHYYSSLYRLKLVRDKQDNEVYYYLDFLQEGKGKLSESNRHKELTAIQVIIGIMLLKMYYARYLEQEKMITLDDIKKEIRESKNSDSYKAVLFNDVREYYSDKEWKEKVEKPIRKTISEFDRLGWVKKSSESNLVFTLRASIHRFARIYENEITNFDKFSEQYYLEKTRH